MVVYCAVVASGSRSHSHVDVQFLHDSLFALFNDILKEEADTIEASGFEVKELGKPISDIAKRFYIKALG